MNDKERQVHNSIYKLITPDKPVIVVPLKAEGNREYLKDLISEAEQTTKVELGKLVKRGHFSKSEADDIFSALMSLSKIVERPDASCLVGVFAEYKDNELYLHSVAVPA